VSTLENKTFKEFFLSLEEKRKKIVLLRISNIWNINRNTILNRNKILTGAKFLT
jgi:hypothetical protein